MEIICGGARTGKTSRIVGAASRLLANDERAKVVIVAMSESSGMAIRRAILRSLSEQGLKCSESRIILTTPFAHETLMGVSKNAHVFIDDALGWVKIFIPGAEIDMATIELDAEDSAEEVTAYRGYRDIRC